MSKDPGKLSVLKPLRSQIDAELAEAISWEQAIARGLEESSGCFAIRIWNNCIAAIAAKKQAGSRAVLVWRRDRKDVQVWVPAPVKVDEPQQEEVAEA